MGRRESIIAVGALLALGGCAARPAGEDLFGRKAVPLVARMVADGPDDLLEGIVLRPLPTAEQASAASMVRADAAEVEASIYVVQPGDTLRGIGNRTRAGAEAIAIANALEPPYLIRAGQRLTIPPGRYHEVRAGETGIAIARAYGSDWSSIIAENGLRPPYALRLGQRLRLPASPAPAIRAATPEERARAFVLDIDEIVTGSAPAAAAPGAPPPRGAVPGPVAGSARFVWPVEGRILQRFGPVGGGRINDGIKIAAALGAPVRAAGGGTVAYAGTEVPLLGGLVLIDHGGGWISAYGHLGEVAVRAGDRVAAGAVIATAGETGQAREPQLHFELRQNRRPVDPVQQLPRQ